MTRRALLRGTLLAPLGGVLLGVREEQPYPHFEHYTFTDVSGHKVYGVKKVWRLRS
jgi:hypothetical protein